MNPQSEEFTSEGILRWFALRGWTSVRREISRQELQEYVWKLEKGILKIKKQQAKEVRGRYEYER